MLNRRILRIKAMQALYAFFATGNTDLKSGEVELNRNISKFYELYLILFSITADVLHYMADKLEEGKKKHIASEEDLTPNTWLQDNYMAMALRESSDLNKELTRYKINTRGEKDLIHKIYQNVKASKEYQDFVASESNTGAQDFFVFMFKEYIANEPSVSYFLEEQNIYFLGDLDMVSFLVIKTLKTWEENTPPSHQRLQPLYKNFEEDYQFVLNLFRQTIIHKVEYEKMISEFTPNWEADRLAQMDMLLLTMAVVELLNSPSIPVKVTLNEYIDISKEYSSSNSKTFINGVLDNIISDLKRKDKIKKVGRGLME